MILAKRILLSMLAGVLAIGAFVFGAGVAARVECPLGDAVAADLGGGVVMHTCLWQKAPDEVLRVGALLLVKNGVPILSARTNRNGKLHGLFVSWTDDGVVTERGEYRDGRKQGVWLITDKHGRRAKLYYDDGRLLER